MINLEMRKEEIRRIDDQRIEEISRKGGYEILQEKKRQELLDKDDAAEIIKDLSSENPKLEVDKYIHKHKKNTLLGVAIAVGNEKAVDILLENEFDVNKRYFNGFSQFGHALNIYVNFAKDVAKNGYGRDQRIKTQFSERTLESTESIVSKLLERADPETLERPFTHDKRNVIYKVSTLNSLVHVEDASPDLLAQAVSRIKENGGNPLEALSKTDNSISNTKGYFNVLDVLMHYGNTKAADAVLDSLSPQEQYELLLRSADSVEESKGAISKMTLRTDADSSTLKWFDSRFDKATWECNVEAFKSDKEVDEYWDKEAEKEQAVKDREQNKKTKNAQKKAKKKEKLTKQKIVSAVEDESVQSDSKYEELPDDTVFVPGDHDFEEKTKKFLVGRFQKMIQESGMSDERPLHNSVNYR